MIRAYTDNLDVLVWRGINEDIENKDQFYKTSVVKTASTEKRSSKWNSGEDKDGTYVRPKPREAVLSINLDF